MYYRSIAHPCESIQIWHEWSFLWLLGWNNFFGLIHVSVIAHDTYIGPRNKSQAFCLQPPYSCHFCNLILRIILTIFGKSKVNFNLPYMLLRDAWSLTISSTTFFAPCLHVHVVFHVVFLSGTCWQSQRNNEIDIILSLQSVPGSPQPQGEPGTPYCPKCSSAQVVGPRSAAQSVSAYSNGNSRKKNSINSHALLRQQRDQGSMSAR